MAMMQVRWSLSSAQGKRKTLTSSYVPPNKRSGAAAPPAPPKAASAGAAAINSLASPELTQIVGELQQAGLLGPSGELLGDTTHAPTQKGLTGDASLADESPVSSMVDLTDYERVTQSDMLDPLELLRSMDEAANKAVGGGAMDMDIEVSAGADVADLMDPDQWFDLPQLEGHEGGELLEHVESIIDCSTAHSLGDAATVFAFDDSEVATSDHPAPDCLEARGASQLPPPSSTGGGGRKSLVWQTMNVIPTAR